MAVDDLTKRRVADAIVLRCGSKLSLMTMLLAYMIIVLLETAFFVPCPTHILLVACICSVKVSSSDTAS